MQKKSLVILALALTQWPTLAAAEEDFGPLPSAFFTFPEALYGCSAQGQCSVPSAKQIEEIIQAFEANASKRHRALESVIEHYETIELTLINLSKQASANGKHRSSSYFYRLAETVTPSLATRFKDADGRTPPASELLEFFGESAELAANLKALKKAVASWEYRIGASQSERVRNWSRNKLNEEYFKLTREESPIGQAVWRLSEIGMVVKKNSKLPVSLLQDPKAKMALSIEPFLDFNNCEGIAEKASEPFATTLLSAPDLQDNSPFSALDDAELLMNLLDGRNGQSLSIFCKKVLPRPLSPKYDERAHAISYPWFQLRQALKTPDAKKVRDLLRNELSR